ncbi:signal peptidase I [Nocardioides sp. CFH 31398]|uniref:signal peptidase I n=1 Tax=Nocardioides sp. CFH 31398 TaxID=2919579 RepID=UPI001F06E2F2|nr:signal peptidase I [Nocardioides sp. CFH 31398]MCH1867560.1 signal peptidase I [Nocardioides sp. CFH 31398]
MARVLGVGVCLLAGVVVVLAVVVPRVTGSTPYTVLTGSMAPGLPVGTLVVVRPVSAEDVRIGTVLTYQLRSGQPEVVTHRVIGTRQGPDGREFVTQGDANAVPDAEPVLEQQVRGEVWYSLPWVGRVSHALDPGQRRSVTAVLAGGLALYAGLSFGAAGLQARRGRRERRARRTEGVREAAA